MAPTLFGPTFWQRYYNQLELLGNTDLLGDKRIWETKYAENEIILIVLLNNSVIQATMISLNNSAGTDGGSCSRV